MEDKTEIKEADARNRVQEIKKFYWLLITSIFASVFMLFMAWFIAKGDDQYSDVPITIFLTTPFVFGVIIIIQYLKVFNRGPFSAKNWEKRQIKKYIEQERSEAEKYR